jgi:hypothetical protein
MINFLWNTTSLQHEKKKIKKGMIRGKTQAYLYPPREEATCSFICESKSSHKVYLKCFR